MGTALRKRRVEKSKEGTALGGRGWGKPTDVKVSTLQRYYARAVCPNNRSVRDECDHGDVVPLRLD